MRVLFINQVFWPDVAATAQHADDLARDLVRRGHDVHVIASRSLYGRKGADLPSSEDRDGVRVHRVGVSLFGKSSVAARLLDFLLFYALAALKAFTVPRPDVVVSFTTPPFISLLGVALRAFRGCRAVYWLMDLYPDVAVACGVMKERSLATRFFDAVNRFCLRRSDRVVVLGRCMEERVVAKRGVDASRVVRIGVWSDGSEVAPVDRAVNPYREEWGLGDRFVVMYSGNFGLGHDVETMLESAALLDDDDRFRFVFVGGGKKKPRVEAFVRERGLRHAVVADYQPRERLGASLSAADAHIVSVLEGVEGCVVPCKLFGIMAVGRPALFVGSGRSEIARVLEETGSGEVVAQGDAAGLADRIRALQTDHPRAASMGERGRHALSEVFSREAACAAWAELLEELAPHRRRARPAGEPVVAPAATEHAP